MKEQHVCSSASCCASKRLFCNELVGKIFLTLAGVALVYGIVFLGTLIRNNIKEYSVIGKAEKQERLITIEADGTVTATPDLATVTMGARTLAPTVAEAQTVNSEMLNKLHTRLQELGISKDDIQTKNYNVYPQYQYTEEGEQIDGYNVEQQVVVKIRNLDNASKVLALSGELGLNQISGLQFTLDDEDAYIKQAREDAMKQVQEKARILSTQLGVDIVGVVSYNEYNQSGYGPRPLYAQYDSYALSTAPTVEEGTTDISLHVSVTFEIK